MLYHCFASFKRSLLDFFKLVDSRLVLMLLYDSLNLIISGVHQSHLGCDGVSLVSEKVKLRGLDYVTCKMCQCADLCVYLQIKMKHLREKIQFPCFQFRKVVQKH